MRGTVLASAAPACVTLFPCAALARADTSRNSPTPKEEAKRAQVLLCRASITWRTTGVMSSLNAHSVLRTPRHAVRE